MFSLQCKISLISNRKRNAFFMYLPEWKLIVNTLITMLSTEVKGFEPKTICNQVRWKCFNVVEFFSLQKMRHCNADIQRGLNGMAPGIFPGSIHSHSTFWNRWLIKAVKGKICKYHQSAPTPPKKTSFTESEHTGINGGQRNQRRCRWWAQGWSRFYKLARRSCKWLPIRT